jgi:hypothetical protein
MRSKSDFAGARPVALQLVDMAMTRTKPPAVISKATVLSGRS